MLLVCVYNAYIRLNIQELKHLSFHYDKNLIFLVGFLCRTMPGLSCLFLPVAQNPLVSLCLPYHSLLFSFPLVQLLGGNPSKGFT